MDKKMLEQYGSIKREIEDLKNRRARLLSSAKEMPVVDTVSSSSRHICVFRTWVERLTIVKMTKPAGRKRTNRTGGM